MLWPEKYNFETFSLDKICSQSKRVRHQSHMCVCRRIYFCELTRANILMYGWCCSSLSQQTITSSETTFFSEHNKRTTWTMHEPYCTTRRELYQWTATIALTVGSWLHSGTWSGLIQYQDCQIDQTKNDEKKLCYENGRV